MDYANRKRPPKRTPPKKSRKSTPATAKPAVPWLVVLLAIVLVGGFAWFLSAISNRAEQPAQQPQAIDVPQTQTPTQQAEPLPEQPEEPWQYIEVGDNKEVIVDVRARQLGSPKPMHSGSFCNKYDT